MGAIISLLFGLFGLAFFVLIIGGVWKVFTKAGKPGWAAIIPVYNLIVLLEIGGKPLWWIVLFFIPIVQIVMFILVGIAVAEKFGKGAGFGVGLALLGFIFYPILGFGDATYQGDQAAPPQL
ncbi:MAG: signal peptidase I [Proteobacteria bacterium]|nr:signal peptidase I [Pseudomonadota bacterium]